MYKLGNDVVDLSLPDAKQKYLNTRFLQRVFSLQERCAIESSHDKDRIFWAIWAAKEAAYKACQKLIPNLIFAHQQFRVTEKTLEQLQQDLLTPPFEKGGVSSYGQLTYHDLFFSIRWYCDDDKVHCVAVLSPHHGLFQKWEKIHWHVCEMDFDLFPEESSLTRFYARQFFQQFIPDVNIIRQEREPPLLCRKEQVLTDHEISLSHDGRWAAFALLF